MKKGMQGVAVIVGIVFLLVAGMAIAGTTFEDVIVMENKQAYDKHTKGIISFTHKKHAEDYGIGCGDCHHDDQGKPLDLKIGDDVQSCLECHVKGQADRAKLRGMSREERQKEELKYHYGAIHANCQGCHEDYNVEKAGDKRKGPAPVSCTQCHPRTPR